jgi:hypothetical protein
MARDIFGNKKVVKIDRHTRSKYTDSDIRWEKFKMVIWLLLGGIYAYIILQPQHWF